MSSKNVILIGATGAIGREVYKELVKNEYKPIVVARDIGKARLYFPEAELLVTYDPGSVEKLSSVMEGSFGAINLAGAPIFGKWKGDYEREVVDSRVAGTAYVVKAISQCHEKPEVFINGSASGLYGYGVSNILTEDSPAGNDFWGRLVKDWEAEALKGKESGLRIVLLRTTLVLKEGEGALGVLVPYFKKGLGGYVRPGDQQFPWISMKDEVGIIMQCLKNESFSGPINCVAGNISSRQFSANIGAALNRRGSFPIPGFLIRSMFGKASDLVTKSQVVSSSRMEELGYTIQEENMEETLNTFFKKDHSVP